MTANVVGETTTLATANIGWLLAFHRGWIDRQNGIWPKKAYDSMSCNEQWAYECGRLSVLCVMNAGPVPIWRGDRHTAVNVAWPAVERAIAIVGNPFEGLS